MPPNRRIRRTTVDNLILFLKLEEHERDLSNQCIEIIDAVRNRRNQTDARRLDRIQQAVRNIRQCCDGIDKEIAGEKE